MRIDRTPLPITHPIALMALAVLVLNDHVLKDLWPGLITGKLSDIAGLILFPALLESGWRVVRPAAPAGSALRRIILAVALTAVAFGLMKLWPPAADSYRFGLGALQWILAATAAPLLGNPPPVVRPVAFATDISDLIALPALLVPIRIVGNLSKHGERAHHQTGTNRRQAEIAVLIAASFATMATSQTLPSVDSSTGPQVVRLTSPMPILVQRLKYAYLDGPGAVYNRTLSIDRSFLRWAEASGKGNPPNVRLIVIRDGVLEPIPFNDGSGITDQPPPEPYFPLYEFQDDGQILPACRAGERCEANFELIWRLDGDAGDSSVELGWVARGSMQYGDIESPPPGAILSVELSGEPRALAMPPALRDDRTSQLTLTTERPRRSPGLLLTLSREAVEAVADYPEWATLRVRILNATRTDPSWYTRVSFDVREMLSSDVVIWGGGTEVVGFPFRNCASNADCRREILFDFDLDTSDPTGEGKTPRQQSTIDWAASVEVAFPGLDTAPAGAMLKVEDICVAEPSV